MYDIINFLELEDDDLNILSTTTEYDTKIITLEKALKAHFCPHCGSYPFFYFISFRFFLFLISFIQLHLLSLNPQQLLSHNPLYFH